MSTRGKTVTILFCLLLVAFGFGLYRLMALRFDAGDVFPAYSSLRSDPVGSKVLYQSFRRLPGARVERHFQPLDTLQDALPSTVFLFGLSPIELDLSLAKQVEDLAQRGHRVVLAMEPVQGKAGDGPAGQEQEEGEEGTSGGDPKEANCGTGVPLFKRWGFGFGYTGLSEKEEGSYPSADLVPEAFRGQLPGRITQHSELYFTDPQEAWKVFYRLGDRAVIMERFSGDGSLVLVSDSYLVSNEAMRLERHSRLLAWLAGGHRQLVFDETHFGLRRQPGVMVLVRQYRLAGVLGVLLVLGLLYLWQRSVPFIPLRGAWPDAGAEEMSTMDYHAGLVNLLRRNVKQDDLLPACFNEWLKALPGAGSRMPESVARVRELVAAEQAAPPRERNLPGCYRKIAGILAERKHLWK